MKTFILIFVMIFLRTHEAIGDDLHFIAKVLINNQKIQIIQDGKQFIFPVEVSDSIAARLKELRPDDDAIINGHLRYDRPTSNDKTIFNTFFVVDSVQPISLQRLKPSVVMDLDRKMDLLPLQSPYHPLTIPVSSGVATALTMTVTGVLLNDLATPIADAPIRNQSNGIVLIGAGVLLTGALIYDQIFSHEKTKEEL